MRLLTLSFLLLATTINAQQGYLITYSLDYIPDTTSVKKISEYFILKIQNNRSHYVSQTKILQDSIREEARKNQALALQLLGDLSKIPKTNFKYEIFTFDNSMILLNEKIGGREYYYEQPINDLMNWKIDSEIKEVNGIKCQLATTNFGGREYEAWFSLDIPASLGPYKFIGLPGLIISINDLENNYRFQVVDISQTQNLNIEENPEKRSKKNKQKRISRYKT
jgi:GLPGLI family protein